MYRVSNEEVSAAQVEYKKKYPAFEPFTPSAGVKTGLSDRFCNLLVTQNGQDTDDYLIDSNNKVERYLKGVPAGSEVLLLGVGTGRECLVAKDLGFNVVGTTFGSRNVYFGRQYLGLKETEIIECANEVLPFCSQTFDVVAGFQVFEHAMAPLLFLLEQTRVLKPGGLLLLEWPPPKDYTMGDNPHHQVCFTPGQARALFQKAHLMDIKVYYDDHTPIPEEDMWRGDQDKMLCIEGRRAVSSHGYVVRARGF